MPPSLTTQKSMQQIFYLRLSYSHKLGSNNRLFTQERKNYTRWCYKYWISPCTFSPIYSVEWCFNCGGRYKLCFITLRSHLPILAELYCSGLVLQTWKKWISKNIPLKQKINQYYNWLCPPGSNLPYLLQQNKSGTSRTCDLVRHRVPSATHTQDVTFSRFNLSVSQGPL